MTQPALERRLPSALPGCGTLRRGQLTMQGVEMAKRVGGSIESRPGGTARITFRENGKRLRVSHMEAAAGIWIPLTQDMAEAIRDAIWAEVGKGTPLVEALAPYDRSPKPENDVLQIMDAFADHMERRAEAGEVALRTVREIRKLLSDGGPFSYWQGWNAFTLSYGALKDWHLWLAMGGGSENDKRAPRTVETISSTLRRALFWRKQYGAHELQAFLGHASRVSTDKYVAIAEASDLLAREEND